MARKRSEAYKRIRDRVASDLYDKSWKPWGARWRNRVGLPRMTAEAVAAEADTLLHDINMSTHRGDPGLEGLLEAARVAVNDYYGAVVRDNWDRVQRLGKYEPSNTERSE